MLRNKPSFHRILDRSFDGVEEALLVRSMDVVDVGRVEESKCVLLGVPLSSVVWRGVGEGEDGIDAVVWTTRKRREGGGVSGRKKGRGTEGGREDEQGYAWERRGTDEDGQG